MDQGNVSKLTINGMTPDELDRLYFRALVGLSLARLYDAHLVLIASLAGEEVAEAILAKHTAGELWYPPPAVNIVAAAGSEKGNDNAIEA